MDWTNNLKGVQERKNQYLGNEKYFYKLNITYGFILGFIIDNAIPCTLGLPIQLLKGFGKTLYSRRIKLNKYTNNSYIRGFLE